jgi:hypothetical protein
VGLPGNVATLSIMQIDEKPLKTQAARFQV